MRINKRLFCLLIAGVCLLCCIFFCIGAVRTNDKTIIPENVCIEGVDVSKMTADEAIMACDEILDKLSDTKIVFYCDIGQLEYCLSDIGYTTNLEENISYSINYCRSGNVLKRLKHTLELTWGKGINLNISVKSPDNVLGVLDNLLYDFNVDAKSASLMFDDAKPVIVPEMSGYRVDVGRTAEEFTSALENLVIGESIRVKVYLSILEPEIVSEDLEHIEDILGEFETDYNSDEGRMSNVENAVRFIDGTILMPGEEFNTNNLIEPITLENGYSHAPEFYAGKVVDGVGGGVCQVSTTLYNAVLNAELKVTERSNHSMAVSYVPLATDAALAENVKNFRFVNSKDYPIYIRGICSEGRLCFKIYGHEDRPYNRTLEFESKLIRTIPPGEPIETVDLSLPPGTRSTTQKARNGYVTELWKHIYIDGEQKDSVKINTSNYIATPEYISVGQ